MYDYIFKYISIGTQKLLFCYYKFNQAYKNFEIPPAITVINSTHRNIRRIRSIPTVFEFIRRGRPRENSTIRGCQFSSHFPSILHPRATTKPHRWRHRILSQQTQPTTKKKKHYFLPTRISFQQLSSPPQTRSHSLLYVPSRQFHIAAVTAGRCVCRFLKGNSLAWPHRAL